MATENAIVVGKEVSEDAGIDVAVSPSWKIALAELIGTFVLVLGGCGTAVLATGLGADVTETLAGNNTMGLVGVSLAFGLTVLVMAYAIGHISGCHINPAVTLGMAISGKIPWVSVPIYWGAQIVGGILGATTIFGIASSNSVFDVKKGSFAANGWGPDGSPAGFGFWGMVLVEVVLTAVFVLVVIGTTQSRFPAGFGGVAAGLALTLVHLISIPVDNTSVNPARSLAVAIFRGDWALTQVWAFWVFPLVGAAIAAVIWKVFSPGEN
ncbi:MAG: aquaporin Z [Acidimicrobiia bacterium]